MTNWSSRIRAAATAAEKVLDDDVIEELALHAQSAFQAAVAEGCSLDEAERSILVLIEGWIREADGLRRRPRSRVLIESPVASRSRLGGLGNDMRFGLRVLVRQPSFSILATVTMAVGIGVMTTVFSVAYGVLMRPLPWPEPDRLLRLTETHSGATRPMALTMTNMAYVPWRDHATTIDSLAAWSRRTVTVTGDGEAERLLVSANSSSLFTLLRAKPLIGTVFAAEDELPNPPVSKIVLSFGLWQQRFGGQTDVLGRTLQLDGKPYIIAGVMPRGFVFPDGDVRAWLPMYIPPLVDAGGKRALLIFNAMARLKPGVTAQQAAAEASAWARTGPDSGDIGVATYGTNSPAEVEVSPALDALTAGVRPAIVMLLCGVALLLITALANVASLQLARATTRQREMAIRSAIGAGAPRITRQLLVEGLLLGVCGGIAGLVLAAALHSMLPLILPADFPRSESIGLSGIVISFAVILTSLTGVVLGVTPALNLGQVSLVQTLIDNGAASIGSGRTWLPKARFIIMVAQIAVSCTLLIGAALLMRSFLAMVHADRGFDARHVLTARIGMPDFAFTPERRIEVLDRFLDRGRSLPGAEHIGFTTGLPLINSETSTGFKMKSVKPPLGTETQVHSALSVVTDDYFAAIGMRIIAGRAYTSADTATSPKVVIVNRTFANQYLSGKALGDHIANFGDEDNVEYEVIGIVDDVLKHGVSEAPRAEIYCLNRQVSARIVNPNMGGSIVMRTQGDPRSLVESLRRIASEEDRSMTLESIATMEDRVATALARPRLYAILLGTFAVSALVIASVGLFGLISYSVGQRKREIAIRTALGATPAEVLRFVLGQALSVTIAGLALGISLSLAVIGYLSTLLYGITVHDVTSFVAVPVTIVVLASLASLVPAIRAARIDAMTTIRSV